MKLPVCIAPAVLSLVLANYAIAQSTAEAYRKRMADSIKSAYMTEAAISNPVMRRATISVDAIPTNSIRSYLQGNKIFEGNVKQRRVNALLSVPVKSWGNNAVSATFSAFQQSLHFSNIAASENIQHELEGQTVNKLTVGFTGSYMHRDSLLGYPIMLTGSISGLTSSAASIQKMSYLFGFIVMAKQTQTVRTSLGILLNFDPAVKVPVVPLISIWRRYPGGMELNVNAPQQVALRKTLGKKFYGSFATTLSGSAAFFDLNSAILPAEANYTTLDLKTGPGLEYRIAKKMLIGVNAGLLTPLQARAFDTRLNANEYFLRNKVNNSLFCNFTFSLLP